jgi:hypothetical protein
MTKKAASKGRSGGARRNSVPLQHPSRDARLAGGGLDHLTTAGLLFSETATSHPHERERALAASVALVLRAVEEVYLARDVDALRLRRCGSSIVTWARKILRRSQSMPSIELAEIARSLRDAIDAWCRASSPPTRAFVADRVGQVLRRRAPWIIRSGAGPLAERIYRSMPWCESGRGTKRPGPDRTRRALGHPFEEDADETVRAAFGAVGATRAQRALVADALRAGRPRRAGRADR